MEKEKEIKQKKNHDGLLWIITIMLFVAGIAGYMYWEGQERQKDIEAGIVSPDPVVEAVDKTTWEELPVGLVYEVPEELQEQYLGYAKAKYEKYKDLGPQQKESMEQSLPGVYLETREDVTPRYNEKPSDMLNEDFSLRYPDMFFGFIIHDEAITGEMSKFLKSYKYEQIGETFVQDKMNQILFVEDYYANGGRVYLNSTLKNKYSGAANSSTWDYPETFMISRAIKSGFFEEKKNIIDGVFEYMFTAGNILEEDAYQVAYNIMAIENTEYFKEADNIIAFPEKYNDVSSWDNTYPIFYYPTKVWKIDNNSIVIDFAVVDGDRATSTDMYEILTKLNQANLTVVSKDVGEFDEVQHTDNTYMVLGRFFDSENITNGLLAEYGTHIINHKTLGDWRNGRFTILDRGTYVFNEKAKEFLSDYYDLLENDLKNNKTPSTRQLLKKAASMNDISYKDAMSIYATYYTSATMTNFSSPVDWD